MKKFNIIAAVGLDGSIGNPDGSLPWNIPEDLQWFKAMTENNTVVMGAKTFNSLPFKLPKRKNVIITTGKTPLKYQADFTYNNLLDAIIREKEDLFVIGGGQLYERAFRIYPNKLYITKVHSSPNSDVKFPIKGDALGNSEISFKWNLNNGQQLANFTYRLISESKRKTSIKGTDFEHFIYQSN